MDRTVYYSSYDSDMVESADQDYELPEDYKWISTTVSDRIKAGILYVLALCFSFLYAKTVWNLKIVGREKLKPAQKDGYFIYSNHTQPFGDVFIPIYTNRGNRIYVIVSTANYGIPVIGRILPNLGALPIPDGRGQMMSFLKAVEERAKCGHGIVVFPEAHVWPYCTEIRPFSEVSFHYPVSTGKPAFSMTVTYRKKRIGFHPAMTVTIDGPFYPDETLKRKDRQKKLCDEVTQAMKKRVSENNHVFVDYVKQP